MKWAEMHSRTRDTLVGEKIFGHIVKPFSGDVWIFDDDPVLSLFQEVLPHYTTEMGAAWLVVERMLEKVVFTCEVGDWSNESKYVVITFDRTPAQSEIRTSAPTMPEAICRAALKVVGYEIEET